MADLTNEGFADIADRWQPLIWRAAIDYALPGKVDVDDLVQEGLKLLFEEVTKRVNTLQMWEVDSNDFARYFKSALFHRFVDLKRSHTTKKRDYKLEVYTTDEYDPLASLMIASLDNAEDDIISSALYQQLFSRLSASHQKVLECQVHPSEELLKFIRVHRCPECLYFGDPTPDGKCPACISNGFYPPANLVSSKSPSRVLQSEIQEFLGMKRMAVSDAIYTIRAELKNLQTSPDRVSSSCSLNSFMEFFGYGNVIDDDDFAEVTPWPLVSSCRYEEGEPSREPIDRDDLLSILVGDEITLLNFMMTHVNEYYVRLRFTEMAKRLNISVHRLREAVDSIRLKLELVDIGVPLNDIPRSI